jgi:hypothetical protein
MPKKQITELSDVKFEDLTLVTMKIAVF